MHVLTARCAWLHAGEGKDLTVVTIGDKGRGQLSRAEPKLFTQAFQDTYKMRVTFSQV